MTPSRTTLLTARLDEHRLIADLRDLEIARQRCFDLVQLLLDAVDDRERRDRAVLQHLHQHRAVAVDVHDIGLRRIAVAHMSDVVDIDHRAVDALDRQIAQFGDHGRRVVELDARIRTMPIFSVPTGVIRFCAASALATSWPDRPRACIAAGSRSIWTCRNLPP